MTSSPKSPGSRMVSSLASVNLKLFPDFELILNFYLVFYMFLTLQFDPWDNACAKALFLRL